MTRVERFRRLVARFVVRLGDRQLGIFERGILRRVVLASLPFSMKLMFRRRFATGVDGTLELRLLRRGGGADHVEVCVSRGGCSIRKRVSDWPTAVIELGIADLLRMAAGAVATPSLVADGRLQLNGDVRLIMRFPALFGLPTRPLV